MLDINLGLVRLGTLDVIVITISFREMDSFSPVFSRFGMLLRWWRWWICTHVIHAAAEGRWPPVFVLPNWLIDHVTVRLGKIIHAMAELIAPSP
jgi:hypothetical protein